MPTLLEAQRAFAAALLGAAPAPSNMPVYRANLYGNWESALAGAYPIVRRIVGDAFFAGMAHAYARAHPSRSGDLNEYGEALPQFAAAWPHTADLPYLPDVARMEWLAHRAYYALDPVPFNPSHPTEARLAPGCALLRSDWPLAVIWAAHQAGGRPETVNLRAGPQRVLIHRPAWSAEVAALTAGDFRFLERLGERATLGAALESALQEDAAFQPAVALAAWVQAGAVAR
jgi:uncharacterized protein